jgi:hypothetical protein
MGVEEGCEKVEMELMASRKSEGKEGGVGCQVLI